MPTTRMTLFVAVAVLGLHSSSCGLIFGGSQEIDTKSHNYEIIKLDQSPMWKSIHESHEADRPPSDREDIAFEHTKTKAVISLNSDCNEPKITSLETLSRELVQGLPEVQPDSAIDAQIDGQKPLVIDHVQALEMTFNTTADSTSVRIRTIVLRKSGCAYDFMYIAEPRYFDQHLDDFNRFVKGFHAR